MKELFVVYEYEKISFLVALKTPQKSEKSSGETSRLRSESLALSQFSEISFLVQLARKVLIPCGIRTFYELLLPVSVCRFFLTRTLTPTGTRSEDHESAPERMLPIVFAASRLAEVVT